VVPPDSQWAGMFSITAMVVPVRGGLGEMSHSVVAEDGAKKLRLVPA